jgi:hypothetical protein
MPSVGWDTTTTSAARWLDRDRTGSPALVTTAIRSGAAPAEYHSQDTGDALDNGLSHTSCPLDIAWAPAPISNAPATAALAALIRFNICKLLSFAECPIRRALASPLQSPYQGKRAVQSAEGV